MEEAVTACVERGNLVLVLYTPASSPNQTRARPTATRAFAPPLGHCLLGRSAGALQKWIMLASDKSGARLSLGNTARVVLARLGFHREPLLAARLLPEKAASGGPETKFPHAHTKPPKPTLVKASQGQISERPPFRGLSWATHIFKVPSKVCTWLMRMSESPTAESVLGSTIGRRLRKSELRGSSRGRLAAPPPDRLLCRPSIKGHAASLPLQTPRAQI